MGMRVRGFVTGLTALATVLTLNVASAAPISPRVGGKLRLFSEQGSSARAPGPLLSPFGRAANNVEEAVPVVVRFQHLPTKADVARLEKLGVAFERSSSGGLAGNGRAVAAEMLASRADLVALDPSVEQIELDGRPFRAPRPLEFTTGLVSADAVRRTYDANGQAIDGTGVVVCDIDAGIDVMHPMFFRADGGFYDFHDENQNGVLDIDIDSVDLGQGPAIIRRMNGIVSEYTDEKPLFDTEMPALDLAYDYLYADENGDRRRNGGVEEGFHESSPGYGERLFVADDVDASGAIERGEKIVALKTSKIRAFRLGNKVYRRGENLIEAPFKRSMQHGNGAAGVLVGGQAGLRRLVGMAPEAELVMATDEAGGREFAMTSFCVDEGARVVLHEYAPWTTYHLDGSSSLEELIDTTAGDGVSHINPAGNLSGSKKMFARPLAAGSVTSIPIEVPEISASYMLTTLLWREPVAMGKQLAATHPRDLSFVLTSPIGSSIEIALDGSTFDGELDGFAVHATREDSTRGTAKVDVYVYPAEFVFPLESGTWSLTVTDPLPSSAQPLELVGSVFDEVSGWGLGIHFAEHVSEAHLVGWPGTADHGLGVAAFTGHQFGDSPSGARAPYSGRGRRIDGQPLIALAAPDNPIVPARFDERELSFMIYGGTSGASPHVAGAAALLLASDPWLDGAGVKSTLVNNAKGDSFTGPVPNDDFGGGKLDVYRALYGVAAPGGSSPTVAPAEVEMAFGMRDLALEVADPDEPTSDLVIEVDRDYDGVYDDVLEEPVLRLDYGAVAEHFLKVRATDSTGRTAQALVHVTVSDGFGDPQLGDDPDPDDVSFAGGGCGTTRVARPASGVGAVGALAALLGVVLRRRRKRR